MLHISWCSIYLAKKIIEMMQNPSPDPGEGKRVVYKTSDYWTINDAFKSHFV